VVVWPNHEHVIPQAFAGSGTTVLAARAHSIEPSGNGYLYGYEVDTQDASGGRTTVLTYVDTGGAHDEHSAVVEDPVSGELVSVWAYPNDPGLPVLPLVTYRDVVAELLTSLGMPITSPSLSVAAYRPGKRAVVRLDSPEGTLFIKVVRPHRVAQIVKTHEQFVQAGLPVPRVLLSRGDGLLVLERIRGVPAGSKVLAIADDQRFVGSLFALTGRIATVPLTHPARADAMDHADWHRRTLVAALPDRAAEIDALYDAIGRRSIGWAAADRRVVHGDLHLEQVFVDEQEPWRITGLLDIDTAGWGFPVRDIGAVVAHLVVTGLWHRSRGDAERGAAAERLADAIARDWAERTPDQMDRLGPAIGAQLLAHAGGQATTGSATGVATAHQLLTATGAALAGPAPTLSPPSRRA
jgi:aminoglycoside phosphotransferase (APT) family kinase protein